MASENQLGLESFVRANARITLWLARIGALALALIAAVTFADVIARYFFNAPFTFTVEFTEMAMALVVFCGVGLVTHQNAHISADVVTLRLSDRMRVFFALVTNILALAFLLIMVWRLWVRAAFLLGKGDTTPIWGVPLWPIAFAIAFGSIFFLTGVALQLGDAIARIGNPEKPSATSSTAPPPDTI